MPKPAAAAIAEKGSWRRGGGWASGRCPAPRGCLGRAHASPPPPLRLPSLPVSSSPRPGSRLSASFCLHLRRCPLASRRLQHRSVPPPPPAPAPGLRAPVAGGPQALGPPCPARPGPRSSPAAPSAAQAISSGEGGGQKHSQGLLGVPPELGRPEGAGVSPFLFLFLHFLFFFSFFFKVAASAIESILSW